jgi:hypothetical protein
VTVSFGVISTSNEIGSWPGALISMRWPPAVDAELLEGPSNSSMTPTKKPST